MTAFSADRPSLAQAVRFGAEFAQMLGVRGIAMALSFGLAVFLARVLGPDSYGTYAFAIAAFTILQPLAGGGLGTLATRELADGRISPAIISEAINRFVVVSIVLSLLVCLLTSLGVMAFGAATNTLLYMAIIVVPAAVFLETSRGILTGQQRVKAGQFLSEVARPGTFLALCFAFWIAPGLRFDAAVALVLTGISGVLIGFVALRRSPVRLYVLPLRFPPMSEQRQLLRQSLPFALVTALQYIHTRVDILAIGYLMTDTDVGQYQVAIRLANLVSMPASLVAVMMAPQFSKLFHEGRKDDLRHLYWRAQLPAMGSSLPLFLFFFLAGGWFVTFAFGADYAPSVGPLTLLIFAQTLFSSLALTAMLLSMAGQESDVVRVVGLGTLANLGLNVMLIPRYGLIGAAVATSLVGTLTLILLTSVLIRSGLVRKGGRS